jgi:hypothetical protein
LFTSLEKFWRWASNDVLASAFKLHFNVNNSISISNPKIHPPQCLNPRDNDLLFNTKDQPGFPQWQLLLPEEAPQPWFVYTLIALPRDLSISCLSKYPQKPFKFSSYQ